MSNIKSLILGSAAVIAASAGAQAADLPVKAKAVQYVKICSLYGAGFYYIPGTDTCIKLGGYIQADYNINGGNYDKPAWDETAGLNGAGVFGTGSRNSDYYTTRARAQLNLDTRTATEYGVVRTYWSSNFEHSSGFGPSSGNLTLDYGFVQFAGFTFGKAVSGFQTPWGAYGANNNTSFLLGGYDNATGITQIAYTWQFGNGISAQLGVEDNRTINRAQLLNASQAYTLSGAVTPSGAVGGSTAAPVTILASNPLAVAALATGAFPNSYGGNFAPDVTANVRIDQSAFTFQLSGALHAVNATYYSAGIPTTGAGTATTTIETNGHPDTKLGGAVSAGLQLKNLPTGPGDKLTLDGTWSKGSTKYLIGGTTGNNFNLFSGSTNFAGSYQSLAVLPLFDAVYTNGSQLELTTAWGFRGGYSHNWSPNWETTLFGSYTKIDYNTNASAGICANQQNAALGIVTTGGLATNARGSFANGYTCNPDFAIWQIGSRTAWTPVKNLTFSGEVLYTGLDQNNTGSVVFPTSTGASNIGANQTAGGFKPAGTYDYKDQGTWSGSFRVRRTW
ncbi:MAG TPA: porin [Paraburkholderia sp.]